ncbi:MAG: S41 family peptidase [Defluviitaleaceae bacterium]|nr:S41 family peptidase [Defluviitaleaceae bacterium]
MYVLEGNTEKSDNTCRKNILPIIGAVVVLIIAAGIFFASRITDAEEISHEHNGHTGIDTNDILQTVAEEVTSDEYDHIVHINTEDEQTRNLLKLSKVWGFAKYTHQTFLLGEKCWDEELLSLIPIVRFADEADVNDILYNWLIGLGDDGFDDNRSVFLSVPVSLTPSESGILYYKDVIEMIQGEEWLSQLSWKYGVGDYDYIALRVDKNHLELLDEEDESFGWLHSLEMMDNSYMRPLINMGWLSDESFLGSSLVAVFSRFNETPVVNRARAPVSFGIQSQANFPNQQPHPNMDFEDTGYRLLGLFRLWNAMMYFFPYIDIIDDDWTELLIMHIPMMLEGEDRLSYKLTLASLASRLHDAHINFSNQWDMFDGRFGRYVAPALFTEAEGHLVVVQQTQTSNNRQEQGLMPGDVIVRVNGRDVNDVISEKLRYISYPNEEKALVFLAYYGHMPLRQHSSDVPMELYVLRDNTELRVDVEVVPSLRIRGRHSQTLPLRAYERLENNIGLINPFRVGEGSIQHIMEYFSDTSGLIVDLRQYPAHFMMIFELAEFIVETPLLFSRVTMASQAIPGVFIEFGRQYSGGFSGGWNANPYFYENNVVLLMYEGSMSRTEHTILSLRNGSNVTVMGSNSIGANGDIRHLPLPGGLQMQFTSIGIFTSEGKQMQRIGLEPDVYVLRTIAGIRDGRDELLEAAIQYLTGEPS